MLNSVSCASRARGIRGRARRANHNDDARIRLLNGGEIYSVPEMRIAFVRGDRCRVSFCGEVGESPGAGKSYP